MTRNGMNETATVRVMNRTRAHPGDPDPTERPRIESGTGWWPPPVRTMSPAQLASNRKYAPATVAATRWWRRELRRVRVRIPAQRTALIHRKG
ncbi:hypothetical protein BRC78_03630 [Halobacteriales archaeon QH_8_68_33]|nr:MAG: hypothetical protein BRC78_03630 [Halobacteriales archaeon QH_8_68_33]